MEISPVSAKSQMFAKYDSSNAESQKARMFPDDLTSLLSLFVEGKEPIKLSDSEPQKWDSSFESTADGCCENTSSESIEEPNEEEAEVARDHIIFQLNYLPKQITQEEVLEKLVKFGKVQYLSLLPSSPVDQKKHSEKKQGNFRSAEFYFESKGAEQIFLSVKRIRIRGLQVKITQKDSQQEVVDSPINKGEVSLLQDHASDLQSRAFERSTCQKYFSGSPAKVSADSHSKQSQNYFYWRHQPTLV